LILEQITRRQTDARFRRIFRPGGRILAENYSIHDLRDSILEWLRLNDLSERNGIRHRERIFQKAHRRIFLSAPDLLLCTPSIPVKAGHVMISVPAAIVPSARQTVSATVVVDTSFCGTAPKAESRYHSYQCPIKSRPIGRRPASRISVPPTHSRGELQSPRVPLCPLC